MGALRLLKVLSGKRLRSVNSDACPRPTTGFKLFPTDQADDLVIDRRSLLELVRQLAQHICFE